MVKIKKTSIFSSNKKLKQKSAPNKCWGKEAKKQFLSICGKNYSVTAVINQATVLCARSLFKSFFLFSLILHTKKKHRALSSIITRVLWFTSTFFEWKCRLCVGLGIEKHRTGDDRNPPYAHPQLRDFPRLFAFTQPKYPHAAAAARKLRRPLYRLRFAGGTRNPNTPLPEGSKGLAWPWKAHNVWRSV